MFFVDFGMKEQHHWRLLVKSLTRISLPTNPLVGVVSIVCVCMFTCFHFSLSLTLIDEVQQVRKEIQKLEREF